MMMNSTPMPPQTRMLTMLLLSGSLPNTASSLSQLNMAIITVNSTTNRFHTLPNFSKFWCLGSTLRMTSNIISIANGRAAKIKMVDFGPQPLTCPLAPQWVGTMSGREG